MNTAREHVLANEIPVDPAIAHATALAERYTSADEDFGDQLWRMHNIYYIVDKKGNKVLFQPNWAQVKLLEELWYLNIVLKARQLGFTTFIDLLFLDNCLWQSDKRAGIICHNREDAKVIFRDKVKFPFDQLPQQIRESMEPKQDSVNELLFPNNSSIRVGTSLRSGTLNYLHVSEYGKLCAKTPEKAREVKTGALNTVQAGQVIFIESTAEGRAGHFYELSQRAQNLQKLGKQLTPLDYKFHFFSWWEHPEYELADRDTRDAVIPKDYLEYFDELESKIGKALSLGQKLWYIKKAADQGEDMKREYPSTPEEAFYASIEGAYYKNQMAQVRLTKRIRPVPWQPTFPVNFFWDIGYNDDTFIICHQHIGLEHRFINAYTNSGEALAHYVNWIQKQGYVMGRTYLPHDAEAHSVQTGKTARDVLWDLGLRQMTVVDRIEQEKDGIEAVRGILPMCWFDEANTGDLIDALDHYRKEWDDKKGTWDDHALHDWASHGSKAFECFARGYRGTSTDTKKRKRPRSNRYMAM